MLASVKYSLPGFHKVALAILRKDVTDVVSSFAVALRKYDELTRSQIIVLLRLSNNK